MAEDKFILDLAWNIDGSLYHGTLSLINDKVHETWTYDTKEGKKTQDVVLSKNEFSELWDYFATGGKFDKFRVKGPDTIMDFEMNMVAAVMYELDGKSGVTTFLVPNKEITEDFIKLLSIPKP